MLMLLTLLQLAVTVSLLLAVLEKQVLTMMELVMAQLTLSNSTKHLTANVIEALLQTQLQLLVQV